MTVVWILPSQALLWRVDEMGMSEVATGRIAPAAAETPFAVTCGSCGTRLRVRGQADGKIGKCPKCGVRFRIVLPKASAAPGPTDVTAVATVAAARQKRIVAPSTAAVCAPAPSVEQVPATIPEATAQAVQPQALQADLSSTDDWKRGMSPEVLAQIKAEEARLARQGSVSIGVLALASLVAGIAICFQIARYGGEQHWVIKRSIAAWVVGMMAAGAMLVSAMRRGGALRFLAAVIAAAAVIGGKLFAAPATPYQPIDLLFVVLGMAGSTFTFLLTESSSARPAETAPLAAAGEAG